jgi:chemotaxis protein methyltransferase CheR
MSVAAVQNHLQASGRGEQFPIAPYLARLCETLAGSMIGEDRHIEVKVRAGVADVSSTEAVSIGLIVTELVINALKHAFGQPSTTGVIVVSYEAAKASWRLSVSDNGVGMPQDGGGKATPGLGTSIVEALARQLDGHVEISQTIPHGMTVSITHGSFPTRLPEAA